MVVTSVKSFRRIVKNRTNRFVRPCCVCGKKHAKRLTAWTKLDDGSDKYFDFCYGPEGSRELVREFNAQLRARGREDEAIPFEERYPNCWRAFFGRYYVGGGNIRSSGKVLKRDNVLCHGCGTRKCAGGIWLSDNANKLDMDSKVALCEQCTLEKFNEKVA